MIEFIEKEVESSEEYVLPDYMSDIKKMLSVKAAVIPSGKFVGEGEAELSGILRYDILYLSAEGSLQGMSVTTDYDMILKDVDSSCDVGAFYGAPVSTVRVIGPRKISLRSVVRCRICLRTENDIKCSGDVFSDGRTPEILTESVKLTEKYFITSPEREYAEEIGTVADVPPEDITVISSSGYVRVTEAVAVKDGVSVKGEIVLTAIISTVTQPPFAITKRIPFDETVTIGELAEGVDVMGALAEGYLLSVKSDVVDGGDGASVTASCIMEMNVEVAVSSSLDVVKDAYLVDRNTIDCFGELNVKRSSAIRNFNAKKELTLPFSDLGLESVNEILESTAELSSVQVIPGLEVSITADCNLNLVCVYADGTGREGIKSAKADLPVTFSVPITASENERLVTAVSASVTDAVIDGQTLKLSVTLDGVIEAYEVNTVERMISSDDNGEPEKTAGVSKIVVYYPDGNETLFSIAKSFRTTVAKLSSDNGISLAVSSDGSSPIAMPIGSIDGINKLIIY